MQDRVGVFVVILAIFTTIGLLVYVSIILPQQLEARIRASVLAFSTAIELRCPTTSGMCAEVVPLVREIGKQMGLGARALRDLEMAAGLRDVGLCSVPYSIMNDKREEDWTAEEQAIYQRHSEVSGAMLEQIPALSHLSNIVRYHHAPFSKPGNTRGQPLGRSLGPGPRIIKVATEFVWERRERGQLAALREIEAGSGIEYCPEAVVALKAVLTSTGVGKRDAVSA